jgi:hypothetical protein
MNVGVRREGGSERESAREGGREAERLERRREEKKKRWELGTGSV